MRRIIKVHRAKRITSLSLIVVRCGMDLNSYFMCIIEIIIAY